MFCCSLRNSVSIFVGEVSPSCIAAKSSSVRLLPRAFAPPLADSGSCRCSAGPLYVPYSQATAAGRLTFHSTILPTQSRSDSEKADGTARERGPNPPHPVPYREPELPQHSPPPIYPPAKNRHHTTFFLFFCCNQSTYPFFASPTPIHPPTLKR